MKLSVKFDGFLNLLGLIWFLLLLIWNRTRYLKLKGFFSYKVFTINNSGFISFIGAV